MATYAAPFRAFGATAAPTLAAPPMRAVNAPVTVPTAPTVAPRAAPVTTSAPRLWQSPMRIANDLGYTLPYPPALANGQPAWRYDTAPNNAAMVAQMQAGLQAYGNAGNAGTGYAGANAAPSLDIPQGVDENWYREFMAEHPYTTKDGRTIHLTPEQVYDRDGEYAIAHALMDKAWGDQFYRTYGRPPTEYDWKYSYADRQRAFYNGG